MNRAMLEFAMAGGIEMGTAGIHVLYSGVANDPAAHPGFPSPAQVIVRSWCFWSAQPRYPIPYSAWEWHRNDSAEYVYVNYDENAYVNYERIFDDSLFVYQIVREEKGPLYALTGTMNPAGLGVAKQLLEPNAIDPEAGKLTDWYGIKRPISAEQTNLIVILVSEDEAYYPIHLTTIMEEVERDKLSSYAVTLADGLTFVEVNLLLERLQ